MGLHPPHSDGGRLKEGFERARWILRLGLGGLGVGAMLFKHRRQKVVVRFEPLETAYSEVALSGAHLKAAKTPWDHMSLATMERDDNESIATDFMLPLPRQLWSDGPARGRFLERMTWHFNRRVADLDFDLDVAIDDDSAGWRPCGNGHKFDRSTIRFGSSGGFRGRGRGSRGGGGGGDDDDDVDDGGGAGSGELSSSYRGTYVNLGGSMRKQALLVTN